MVGKKIEGSLYQASVCFNLFELIVMDIGFCLVESICFYAMDTTRFCENMYMLLYLELQLEN